MTTTRNPNPRTSSIPETGEASEVCRSALDEAVRRGAQAMLQAAVEAEAAEYVEARCGNLDAEGRRLVVRNGRTRTRRIQTGAGELEIRAPRVDDRREDYRFTSAILPPYLRRAPSIDSLVPVLYLKGVSTGDIPEALAPILGEGAANLSPATVVRLKEAWTGEFEKWNARDLSGKHYVYFWVDGIYFDVRLSDERPCVLVVVGSLPDGTKEVVAIRDGERESKLSWKELLRDLKRRGLEHPPKLTIGDGALGFWAAVEEEFPSASPQRCWVHKTANVLDKLPKKVQPGAKERIHAIYMAPGRKAAEEAFDEFRELYGAKYPKAWECLNKDRESLLAFYSFPAEHWSHIRSTNVIESTFATVRHRTRQTKGCGSRVATLAMVFKLATEAEKKWRRLNGYEKLARIIAGVTFVDGIEKDTSTKAVA